MKKLLFIIIFTLAIFAGVFTCSNAYAESYLPWNVNVTVTYDGISYTYNLKDNVSDYSDEAEQRGFYLSGKGKKKLFDGLVAIGLPKETAYEYILPNFTQIKNQFKSVCREKVDAAVAFDDGKFTYSVGRDGVEINEYKLFCDMIFSLGRKTIINLPLTIDKAVTVAELKENIVVKGKFTTYFPNSGANRSYNIARSASSINGFILQPNETFSFNNVVGARTTENGYKQAKVIMDGSYTDGVGGGVCQTSTTLYNALLLANFIPRASKHSLVSSYVMAGFDAMVSYGVADLTFVNDTEYPVYIQGAVNGKSVTFTIYGTPNKYRVERVNEEIRDKYKTVEISDKVKYPNLYILMKPK